jgi:hypothetical protein
MHCSGDYASHFSSGSGVIVEKQGSATASMWLALVVQLIGQFFSISKTPMIAKEWVESTIIGTLIPALAKLPVIGFLASYLAMIPVDMWLVILSFFIIWIVGYFIMQQIAGSMGKIIAFGVGVLIVFWLMGGLDFYRPHLPFTPST